MQPNVECYKFNINSVDSTHLTAIVVAGEYPITPCVVVIDELGKRIVPYKFCRIYLNRFIGKRYNELISKFNEVKARYESAINSSISLQSLSSQLKKPLKETDYPQLAESSNYTYLTVDLESPWFDIDSKGNILRKVILSPEQATAEERQAYREILSDTEIPLIIEGYHVFGFRQISKFNIGKQIKLDLDQSHPLHAFYKKYINATSALIRKEGDQISIGFSCATDEDKLSNRIIAHILKMEYEKNSVDSPVGWQEIEYFKDNTHYIFENKEIIDFSKYAKEQQLSLTQINQAKHVLMHINNHITAKWFSMGEFIDEFSKFSGYEAYKVNGMMSDLVEGVMPELGVIDEMASYLRVTPAELLAPIPENITLPTGRSLIEEVLPYIDKFSSPADINFINKLKDAVNNTKAILTFKEAYEMAYKFSIHPMLLVDYTIQEHAGDVAVLTDMWEFQFNLKQINPTLLCDDNKLMDIYRKLLNEKNIDLDQLNIAFTPDEVEYINGHIIRQDLAASNKRVRFCLPLDPMLCVKLNKLLGLDAKTLLKHFDLEMYENMSNVSRRIIEKIEENQCGLIGVVKALGLSYTGLYAILAGSNNVLENDELLYIFTMFGIKLADFIDVLPELTQEQLQNIKLNQQAHSLEYLAPSLEKLMAANNATDEALSLAQQQWQNSLKKKEYYQRLQNKVYKGRSRWAKSISVLAYAGASTGQRVY